MVVIKLLTALVLMAMAAASAGFTGMYFEASKIARDEGSPSSAVRYTAKTISMALTALVLAYVGIRLVQG